MKILSYIVALIIGAFAVYPPIGLNVPMMVNSFTWLYAVVLFGLFGFFLIYTDIALSLKIMSVYLFMCCFISSAPYLSFNAYILFVSTLYFFIVCQKVDYKIVIKMIQAIFWFEVAMTIMHLLGKNTLVCFDRPDKVFLGSVMQYMQYSSLLAILSPFLLLKSKLYIIPIGALVILSKCSSFALSIMAGVVVYYLFKAGRYRSRIILSLIACVIGYLIYDNGSFITEVTIGRLPNWIVIFKTYLQKPFFGWGTSTFSPIYPILIHAENPFDRCHNDFLQWLWEMGIVGFSIIMAYLICLVRKIWRRPELIAGLAIIGTNMFFAFPTHISQCVLVMVAYIALCEQNKEETNGKSNIGNRGLSFNM